MPNETNPPKNWPVTGVVQIDPAHDLRFGGCFLQVTEVKSWGVQGYVAIPGDDCVQAYYRLPWEGGTFIGVAEFVLEKHVEKEPTDGN